MAIATVGRGRAAPAALLRRGEATRLLVFTATTSPTGAAGSSSSPASSSRCSTCSRSASGSASWSTGFELQRAADRLRRVRRARHARRVGDERRDARLDVQLLLQAEVREALRPDAGHAARPPPTSRAARSAGRCCAAASTPPAFLLVMVAMGLVALVVGGAGGAGGAADRVRASPAVGDGADHVHAVLAGLRLRHARRRCRCSCSRRRSSRSPRSPTRCAGWSRLTPLYRGGGALPGAHHRDRHRGLGVLGRLPAGDGGGRAGGRRAPARPAAAAVSAGQGSVTSIFWYHAMLIHGSNL